LLALDTAEGADVHGELWDLSTGVAREQSWSAGLVLTASFAADAEAVRVALAGPGGSSVEVLRSPLPDGTPAVLHRRDGLRAVVSDPAAPILLMQDIEGTLTLWDLRDDRIVEVGARPDDELRGLVASPGLERILVLGDRGPARLIDLSSGEGHALLRAPAAVAWGRELALVHEDGLLELWSEAPSGREDLLSYLRALSRAPVALAPLPSDLLR
jgi:hypothetical protein